MISLACYPRDKVSYAPANPSAAVGFQSSPSSFFSLHGPVRRRQSAKIVGVASFSQYEKVQKRNENDNAKRVRHVNNVAKKCRRPPPKMWKDSGR